MHWLGFCPNISRTAIVKIVDWARRNQVSEAFQDTDADNGWMQRARLAGELRRAHRVMDDDALSLPVREGSAVAEPVAHGATHRHGRRLSLVQICKG